MIKRLGTLLNVFWQIILFYNILSIFAIPVAGFLFKKTKIKHKL